jgi:thiol-disulfide isomerase/thioredoxin
MQQQSTQATNKKILYGGILTTLIIVASALYFLSGLLDKTAQSTGSDNLVIGKAFPDFQITDIKGNDVSPASLSGKPYILWFTAAWCVPCQIGAERVAALDAQTGGDMFNVVVVFVDPKEPNVALRRWKKKHASQDWFVGYDNPVNSLDELVSLQFLDSKYLVDGTGILRNVDYRIADDVYLQRIGNVLNRGENG